MTRINNKEGRNTREAARVKSVWSTGVAGQSEALTARDSPPERPETARKHCFAHTLHNCPSQSSALEMNNATNQSSPLCSRASTCRWLSHFLLCCSRQSNPSFVPYCATERHCAYKASASVDATHNAPPVPASIPKLRLLELHW